MTLVCHSPGTVYKRLSPGLIRDIRDAATFSVAVGTASTIFGEKSGGYNFSYSQEIWLLSFFVIGVSALQFDSTLDLTHSTAFRATQTAQSAKQPLSENSSSKQSTKSLLLLANRFDCETIAGQFRESRTVKVVAATDHFSTGLEQIAMLEPQMVVFDPSINLKGLSLLENLLRSGSLKYLVILDDRVREGVLMKAIQLPRTSYLTRQASAVDFRRAIESIGESSEQVFDAEIEARIVRSSKRHTLVPHADGPALVLLTKREFEVLEHVAAGWSVRECASRLNVAISTVDNHKSRIMKKLNVHKASTLIHLAIREGVVPA